VEKVSIGLHFFKLQNKSDPSTDREITTEDPKERTGKRYDVYNGSEKRSSTVNIEYRL
jgi:hypothetical protein